jgi:putative acetyltransferase
MRIRQETAANYPAIRSVREWAFGGSREADLVDRLRGAGDLVLSLVSVEDRPVGHVAFSRLSTEDRSLRALALAPLGVLPERQRQGIGAALVRYAPAFAGLV